MALHFQSVISGSSGNCVLLWTGGSAILIDAGFQSQGQFTELLGDFLPRLDGVVVSHLHSDHIRYPALRVLEDHGVPLYVHSTDHRFLANKHCGGRKPAGLELRGFSARQFTVGEFAIRPFAVPHEPGYSTFGFQVICTQRGKPRRIVVATDLHDWRDLRGRFENADYIYVEANHDPELLRRNPNYRSQFHLKNTKCGWLLRHAMDNSENYPVGVMLGHLSDIRNDPNLALDTVSGILDDAGHSKVEVSVAPRYEPSCPICIVG